MLCQLVHSGHIAVGRESVTAAAACSGCVCVSEGRNLHVQSERLAVFTFDQDVDAIACWRGPGGAVAAAAADRSGNVHVLSPSLEAVSHSHVVVPQNLPSVQPVFSSLRTIYENAGSLSLLASTVTGTLYIVSPKADSREEKPEVVSVDLTAVYGHNLRVCTEITISNSLHILTAGCGIWPLALWRLDKLSCSLSLSLQVSAIILGGAAVIQADKTADSSYIVTLSDQGEVQVWLVDMMVILGVWGGKRGQPPVAQFSLSFWDGLEQHHLCVLCRGESEEKVVVLTVPGLRQVFCTEVSPGSLLAATSPEGATCLLQPHKSEASTCVNVGVLQCGSPEDRVTELVNGGKFEEAELLVKKHNLDPELVLFKKTAKLNDLVCAGQEGQLPALLLCLRQMKDVEAAATLALESQYPSLATTHSVLSALGSELCGRDSSPASAVISALNRLTTFHLFTIRDSFSEGWSAFQRLPDLQVVAHLLQTGQLPLAKLFWTRHQVAIEEELGKADVGSLLQLIPSDVSSLPSWLPETIFPFLLTNHPHQMKEFLVELSTLLCSQEQSATDGWPANALSVIDQLLVSISKLQQSHGCPPDLSPLTELQEKLVKLASMPAILRYRLSFTSYEQFTPTQLVFRALDQAVDQEHTKQLIAGPLAQFAEQQQLSLDMLLATYLKLFLERAPTHSSDFRGSAWEAKAVALARGVSGSQLQVACCLDLVRCISSPWSSPVASLVHSCLQLQSPNAQELQNLCNLLQMQILLQEKYGITNFNFSDSSTGNVYIRQILVQRRAGVLSDALWVAAKYGVPRCRVYVRHLFRLCCQDQVEEARDVLNSLSHSTLAGIAASAFSFSLSRLKLPFVPALSQPASHCGAAHLALLCIELPPTNLGEGGLCFTDWSWECSAQLLQCVLNLAVEFCLFLSPCQLSSPQYTAKLLQQTLTNFPPSALLPCRALRLGHLLGYSEQEVCCRLVKVWLSKYGSFSLNLLETCPADLTFSIFQSALQADWTLLTPPLVQDLSCLSAQVLSACSPGKLQMALVSFRACSLLQDLLRVCVREEESASWPWAPRVCEHGLQLEPRPSLLQLSSALMLSPNHRGLDSAHLVDVVELLESSGHLSLAHHTAVECQLGLGVETNCNSLLCCLLEKVLSMSQVDHSCGLALLLATPLDTALRLLHSKQSPILSSYSRVIALGALTIDYCRLVSLPQVSSIASTLMTDAVWGKVLRMYQVNFSTAVGGGPEEKKRVWSQMLRLKNVPPGVVLAYCRTYGLDWAGAMLTRLRLVLREWETGYQEGFATNLTSIRKHPFIPTLLNTFLITKVCPYDYDRIQFVLQELQLREGGQPLHHQIQLLLSLLMDYGGRQPPSAEERNWHSAHCHGVCSAGQESSPERLPLHLFLEPSLGLSLIGSEACSLSAVEKLVPMANLMDFPEEELFCVVLRSLDTSQLSFQGLAPLLGSVSDPSTRLALTTELASQLSDKERVVALEAALVLARDCESSLLSLEQQLRETRTRILLEEAGMGRCAAASDSSVISTLYTELPLQQDRPAPATVHEIAQSIADIHKSNFLALISLLLQEWLLPSKPSQQDLNTTLVREMGEVADTKDTCLLENWSRMVYLLTYNPHTEHLAAVLCSWAKASSPAVGASARLCALQLLLTAVPKSIVERVSGGTLADLREEVQGAVFVAELAVVQVALTAEVFQTRRKSSIVCSLLQNRADSPKALRLAADLCLHYQLQDPDLWTRLLAAMLTLKMTEVLQNLLPQLARLGAHYLVESLSSVWQTVVQTSYERGMGRDCLPALRLLYQCPVLLRIDLPAVIHTMMAAGAHGHAISASLLLPPSQRSSRIEAVLRGLNGEKLLQLLEEVTSSSCSQLFLVADEVYRYVDSCGLHECLLGSSFFPHLVEFLITNHQLSSLLTSVLSRGRVSEAAQLVEMYHDRHDISAPAGLEGVKAYLKTNGLGGNEN